MNVSTYEKQAAQPTRLWTLPFVLVCVSSLFFWVSLFGGNTVLPFFMEHGGFQSGAMGWLLGCGAIASVPARIVSGPAIDRRGPRPFLIAGAALLGLTTLPMGFLPGLVWLTLLRLLQGAGLALFMNAAIPLVADVTPPDKRGAALAWWGVTNNAGNALGAAGVGALMVHGGDLASFWVMGAAGVLAALWGLGLPRSVERAPLPAHTRRWYTPSAVVPGLVGGALGFAGGAFMLFAPLRAAALGFGNVGYYLAVYAAGMVAARLVFGPLSDRRGRAWAIVPGMLLVALALVGIGLIQRPVPALVVPLLFGVGLGGSMPSLIAWTIDRAGRVERATAVSTFYLVYDLALFLGSAATGKVLERWPLVAYLGVASVVLLALGLFLAMARVARRKSVLVC